MLLPSDCEPSCERREIKLFQSFFWIFYGSKIIIYSKSLYPGFYGTIPMQRDHAEFAEKMSAEKKIFSVTSASLYSPRETFSKL
jgi:hypothetical protein